MNLNTTEQLAQWTAGLGMLIALALIFNGLWRGIQRSPSLTSGRTQGWLRSPAFYLVTASVYFGVCYLLWQPIPIDFSAAGRLFMLVAGSLLCFPGLALVIWGRLALGRQYFASSALEAQLFTDHQLVTKGPFSLVRHPMYLGLLFASFGALLLFRTWTFTFVALGFIGLIFRAHREEEALAVAFEAWQDYAHSVPFLIPFTSLEQREKLWASPHSFRSVLLELGLLYLPGAPAYYWMWPYLQETEGDVIQSIVYAYILAGGLFIGLRRWNWDQLGLNRKGLWLVLVCGLLILAGRFAIILAVDWVLDPPAFTWLSLAWVLFFYIALVGGVEEFMFRGLVYRLLEDWRGVRWAIWGSSLMFGLWHLFGQGLLVGLVTTCIGLLFGLMRWRAGGITGLILFHGLWDIQSVLLVSLTSSEIQNPAQVGIASYPLLWLGIAPLLLVPFYLWLVHPLVTRAYHKEIRAAA